ncbi:integrase/recombinase clustered with segregation and condensation protein B [Rhizobium leguminosarum bv. phaseoli CCGM1]|uniref:Integrase domain-containing protein n=1 Tax=Rhizobium phaseoli TaxID=396 RepID=A0ABM6CKY7_9HYPH|nr:integrase domain-containing protein [Rhizobium phaseoli]ANL89014.1 integrase domain-containing protein [Rhizobium phaseoli]ANL95523.1 integrase domain-containing protein [Rhizobium phaseoli]KEC71392.1 integrase/recombinase clustered with segregation and condensation protein B [Rhizobium leguminosarum bv. phaseoli CCGM1]
MTKQPGIFQGGAAGKGWRCCRPTHTVGLYITACAASSDGVTASDAAITGRKPNSVTTIKRRLSALAWSYAQRGKPLDRKDRHIVTVLAGIRNTHGAPPRQKEAVLPEQ